MARVKAEIHHVIVDCVCGEEHTLPFSDVGKYVSEGCDSCGHGSYTHYSWVCPTTKKHVDYMDD